MSVTVKEALQRASFALRQAGLDQPRREAEALLCACLGVPLARLYTHDGNPLSPVDEKRYREWVARRAGGEPYAYIAGEREFMGLSFVVSPHVLIPRPDTEILVEAVAAELKDVMAPRILEIGAGSGAVAVSLAVMLPDAFVTAVDISRDALSVAEKNAERHCVRERTRFHCGDLYEPVTSEQFDAVVSNPPYIPSAGLAELEPTVRCFEPGLALDGGEDGLHFYRRLTGELQRLGAPPALLAFEVGMHQADAVAGLCLAAGYTKTRRVKDLAGIDRTILATVYRPLF